MIGMKCLFHPMIILSVFGDKLLIRPAHSYFVIDQNTITGKRSIYWEGIWNISRRRVPHVEDVGRDSLADLRKHLVHDLLVHPSNLCWNITIGIHCIVDVDVAHERHDIAGILTVDGETRLILEL